MESANYKMRKISIKIKRFIDLFDSLKNKGLPSFWDGNGEVHSLDKYKNILKDVKNDNAYIKSFRALFDSVNNKGLPSFWG